MQLTFKTPHLSIVDFSDVTLPAFTLITGVNGVGKTHLLKAIQEGKILADIAPEFKRQARFFDWMTLVPQDRGIYDGHGALQARNQLSTKFDEQFDKYKQQLIQTALNVGLPRELLQNPTKLAQLNREELSKYIAEKELDQAMQQIETARNAVSTNIKNSLRRNQQEVQDLDVLAQRKGCSVAALQRIDFFEELPTNWGRTDVFQQSFAQLFVTYRDLLIENDLKLIAQQKGDHSVSPLSPEEFEANYNIPPWNFVNQTLSAAGLGFQIDHPELYRPIPYQAKLTKTASGAQVKFSDLSSGEKVLMSFALCLYYAEDQRQVAQYPTLLLLDEIDAPLHPSMTRTLIKTITETLVGRFNINVIMTTHSPTTVAIAPDDSIYVMRPDLPGLHKETKNRAINVLTEGIPTLSVSFDDRRQVFVESESDAKVYDTVYRALLHKNYLNTERSLVFIPVGKRSEGGDTNTGCAQVRSIVKSLADAGNTSVFGLVDWDGEKNPSDRVHVLAHEVRNGIENCIFDPLLIAIQVARDAHAKKEKVGLQKKETYTDIQDFSYDRLQSLVDAVCLSLDIQCTDKMPQRYVGGLELQIPRQYLEKDDHELEKKLLALIQEFKQFNRHAGDLLRHVASTTMTEMHQFIPDVFLTAFNDLLDAELL